jgi:hypothetical protein
MFSWLLAKGVPGLCLGFCPRTLVRCKKRCARRRIKSLMRDEEEEEEYGEQHRDTAEEPLIKK